MKSSIHAAAGNAMKLLLLLLPAGCPKHNTNHSPLAAR
jgi:hypothetical protein